MRSYSALRRTLETDIRGSLKIEGTGLALVNTGIGFLDHMLTLFAKHGSFDLELEAVGDLAVDQHHTVEDCGIVLGELVTGSLGERKGINRSGFFLQPMDETLAAVAIDLGGRAACVYLDRIRARRLGEMDTEVLPDFFEGFARSARANVHVKVLYGRSSHHKAEAIFKGFGKALAMACSVDARLLEYVPSSKGIL